MQLPTTSSNYTTTAGQLFPHLLMSCMVPYRGGSMHCLLKKVAIDMFMAKEGSINIYMKK